MDAHAVRFTSATAPKRAVSVSFFGTIGLYRLAFSAYPVTKKCIERYSHGNTDTDPECQASESKANSTSDCNANRQLTERLDAILAFLF